MALLRAVRIALRPKNLTPLAGRQQIRALHEDEHTGLISAPTPFERPKRQCVICKNKIDLDYKNIRLLSQFVSPFTGSVYEKHITGLCQLQQEKLVREVRKARKALLMPHIYKDPQFNDDPALFDPDRPRMPNPY